MESELIVLAGDPSSVRALEYVKARAGRLAAIGVMVRVTSIAREQYAASRNYLANRGVKRGLPAFVTQRGMVTEGGDAVCLLVDRALASAAQEAARAAPQPMSSDQYIGDAIRQLGAEDEGMDDDDELDVGRQMAAWEKRRSRPDPEPKKESRRGGADRPAPPLAGPDQSLGAAIEGQGRRSSDPGRGRGDTSRRSDADSLGEFRAPLGLMATTQGVRDMVDAGPARARGQPVDDDAIERAMLDRLG